MSTELNYQDSKNMWNKLSQDFKDEICNEIAEEEKHLLKCKNIFVKENLDKINKFIHDEFNEEFDFSNWKVEDSDGQETGEYWKCLEVLSCRLSWIIEEYSPNSDGEGIDEMLTTLHFAQTFIDFMQEYEVREKEEDDNEQRYRCGKCQLFRIDGEMYNLSEEIEDPNNLCVFCQQKEVDKAFDFLSNLDIYTIEKLNEMSNDEILNKYEELKEV